ncbi:hypothetical protein DFH06DRAFT_1335282 [Mycena polygramma]|nr:hypothetical protein DFH06DRAFT_1335282 [Mycena polygramma]
MSLEPKTPQKLPQPKSEVNKAKKAPPAAVSSDSDEETLSHKEVLATLKRMADDFCLELAGKHQKLDGNTGSVFLEHLYRVSALDGWWFKIHETRAIVMPIHIPQHWICAFIDFNLKYLAIFDSWKRRVSSNDWERSYHADIFKLIKEWLQRLFLSLGEVIDWTKWHIDASPVNQPYQVNGWDCGPHTCFIMSLLGRRQTNDLRRTNEVITARTVQNFRYVLFAQLMKLKKVSIEPGEDEECGNDSDYPIIVSSPRAEREDDIVSRAATPEDLAVNPMSESSLTPMSSEKTPPVLPRRSERTKK